MDKIVYICGAAYLGLAFPKRKWWDYKKKERTLEFVIRDVFGEKESLGKIESSDKSDSSDGFFSGEEGFPRETEILRETGFLRETEFLLRVRIEEYRTGSFILQTDEYRQNEIRQAFLRCILKKRHYDALFIMDWEGAGFTQLLPELVEDKNYFAVLTGHPEVYEGVMESIAMEYGLIGMIFTDYRDFAWYQRQVCVNRHALILWESGPKREDINGKTIFYRFQKGDFLVDFSGEQDYRRVFLGKRMEADYVNMPIFLDNMVKNRYNSLVNEGLLQNGQWPDAQQNVYRSDHENKLTEKRKGIRKWKKRKIF